MDVMTSAQLRSVSLPSAKRLALRPRHRPSWVLPRRSHSQARTTRALAAATEAWPRTELWLVAPRILRSVPRIAAVWEFLVTEMRRIADGL
jgi:hypothetical protein